MRVESSSLIIDATDLPWRFDSTCRASMNSGSSVMLVWWPDNETDNFFIGYNFPPIKQSLIALCGSVYFLTAFNVRLSSI